VLDLADYLRLVLTARVYDVALESPLERAPRLSARLGNEVWLKREDVQSVFSFKLRGAYNKMAGLATESLARGVVCASAGNHAQGVALSARRLGCRAVIVMPYTTPALKIEAVRTLGAEIVLFGESYSEAADHAVQLGLEHQLTFVHPFDDPAVIAGQGTIGMEILRQHQAPLDAIFVPVGGGGLISGIGAYIKAVRPEIRIIGVQTTDSDAMSRSVAAGQPIELEDVGLFSDGTAVKRVGTETLRLAQMVVDDFILVDTDEVCAAIKDTFQDARLVLEPAGALAVAGVKSYVAASGASGQSLVAVASGANINFDRLRFVAERSEEKESLFAVTIPEVQGSFLRFAELVGPLSITEFNYRMSDDKVAHIFVGIRTETRREATGLAATFRAAGFPTLELTHDELAKEHLRHMVGGRSSLAKGERLFRFLFPERPGALLRFLSEMGPTWNISLFHYRNQGSDSGRVLAGLQIPEHAESQLSEFLDQLGYPYNEETTNPAYHLFLS
jgi:threonine dehydratase